MGNCRKCAGFSLVEIALAIAIVTFAGLSLVGLLALGLKNNGDSKRQLEAANLAEAILSTRRAAPTQDFTSGTSPQANFPLPVLNVSSDDFSTPLYITENGTTTTLASGNSRFGLIYKIITPTSYVPSTSPSSSTVYLCLYWPAGASPTILHLSHFEVTTTIALP